MHLKNTCSEHHISALLQENLSFNEIEKNLSFENSHRKLKEVYLLTKNFKYTITTSERKKVFFTQENQRLRCSRCR